MSDESSEIKTSQSTIVFLSIFYAMISLATRDLSILPSLQESISFRLGIFVPALAAIVFGPVVGGLTAGIGNLLIDMYDIFNTLEASLGVGYILGAIANFLGAYTVGLLASTYRKYRADKSTHLANWRYIIPYTLFSIIGLAGVTGVSIAYGIFYLYFDVLGGDQALASLVDPQLVFLDILLINSAVLVVFMPISLIVYYLADKYQQFRFRRVDQRNKELRMEYLKNGITVTRVELPDHSLWRNQWNPLEMEIQNNTDSKSIFQFEAVATCKIYPQLDRTYELTPNESFVQTFYAMPHDQDSVKIRLRVKKQPQKDVFKATATNETIVDLSATTIQVRSSESLSQFSSVNIVVFIISILWSNIAKFISTGLTIISENSIVITVFVLVEAILFIPFIYFNFRRMKGVFEIQDQLDLSFTSDLQTHKYGDILDTAPRKLQRSKGSVLSLAISRLLMLTSLVLLILYSYVEVYRTTLGSLDPFLEILENDLVFALFTVTLLVFGIVGELTLTSRPELQEDFAVLEQGKVIMKFHPQRPFKINEPNEVTIEVVNPEQSNGLRLQFQGVDTISPSRLELHLAPLETATFKIAITPLETGLRELLAIAYPLFLEDGSLIGFEESEPLTYQKIDYSALGYTILGMTREQFEVLKNIATFGTILATALVTLNQYLNIDDLILRFRDSIPVLAILQIPFVYAYFYFSNRFRRRFNL